MKTNQIIIDIRRCEWTLPEYVLGLPGSDCQLHRGSMLYSIFFLINFFINVTKCYFSNLSYHFGSQLTKKPALLTSDLAENHLNCMSNWARLQRGFGWSEI